MLITTKLKGIQGKPAIRILKILKTINRMPRLTLFTLVFLLQSLPICLTSNGAPCTFINSLNGNTLLQCKSIDTSQDGMGGWQDGNLRKILLHNLDQSFVAKLRSIEISHSQMPVLHLDELSIFRSLESLSVVGAKLVNLTGSLSPQMKTFNISFNNVEILNESVFQNLVVPGSGFQPLTLDLSYNKLEIIPNIIFSLNLNSLRLKGNKFSCNWILTRNEMSRWYYSGKQSILHEPDETACLLESKVFGSITFLGALKIKSSAIEQCEEMIRTTRCDCNLRSTYAPNKRPHDKYPVTHYSIHGNAYYSLKMNCINSSLTYLPKISPFVEELNVSFNQISDLSALSSPNYENLVTLDASNNEISTVDFMNLPKFLQVLFLNRNQITQLNALNITGFLALNIERLQGIGLGENAIHCDCLTATKLRPKLIKHANIFKDWSRITCQVLNISISDLKDYDVCHIEVEPESDWPLHWIILVVLEAFLILIVIIKLWHDQRQFRKTGHLPLCSTWMPRLPCDFMLEGLKDTSPSHHSHAQNGHNRIV